MFRLCVVTSSLLIGLSLSAQTPDTAVLSGHVTDATHAAIAGAHVSATNALTSLVRQTETDGAGHFVLSGLPSAGAYDVAVSREGFEAVAAHVQLAGGSSAMLTLVLKVAGATSTVVVEGAADDVRIDQPQLGIHLNQSQIEVTPLPTRRITYLPLLNAANRPAINQGDIFMNQNLITTNGAGRRQAWFEADGTNGNDMWGRQTIFTNIPLMAVSEMAVLTNAFSAEYGGGTGSVINLVTRSGGDRFHGQLLELWRPAATSASPRSRARGTPAARMCRPARRRFRNLRLAW